MVDIILLLMAIASAISLIVVSPRDLQKAILALREYEGMEFSPTDGRGEDGQARAIPMNFGRSGSHPSTEWPMSQKARSVTINLGVSQEEL
jgi:hypothetical protein